jgi:hypothetical protein
VPVKNAPGHIDPQGQQDQGQDGEPDPEGVQQVEAGPDPGDVLGLEHHKRGIDLGDAGRDREPGLDQALFDDLDEGGHVDLDRVVLDRDRPPTLAGQGGHQLLVGGPVGLDPGVSERWALDYLADLVAGEALDPVGDRGGQGP